MKLFTVMKSLLSTDRLEYENIFNHEIFKRFVYHIYIGTLKTYLLFNPFENKPCFTCLQYKPLEYSVRKGEIARLQTLSAWKSQNMSFGKGLKVSNDKLCMKDLLFLYRWQMGVFSPLTSAKACEKSSWWLWKEKLC